MKKMISSFVLMTIALTTTMTAMADDRAITINQLPKKAQQFITQHFSQNTVSYVTQDTDLFDGEFEVAFTDRSKIDFHKNGEWKQVDCEYSAVPPVIIPQPVKDYVVKNHPTMTIIKIDRDPREYEIKLSDALELKFDLKGNFIRYDY